MIEFHNVHKTYRVAGKEIPALHPTSLRVENGQVFGLIGHSGRGKVPRRAWSIAWNNPAAVRSTSTVKKSPPWTPTACAVFASKSG